jgi:uncharacterized protein (TIGR03086 family)
MEADAAAVRATAAVVAKISVEDLGRPTPCAEWDLAELLAHMAGQHYGFAAAAAGHGDDLTVWRPVPLGDDFVRGYAAAAGRVIDAFGAPGVLDRQFALPEISAENTFPGRVAMSFHLVDYVVHGWDVAASIGVDWDLPDDVVAMALPIARAVPVGPAREVPGAAFAPALPMREEMSPLQEILALLGRSIPFDRQKMSEAADTKFA